MKIKFWGTRGSIPVPGANTLVYGGNTPCVEIRTNDNHIIVLDAGSGIRELGKRLTQKEIDSGIDIFLTHYHWDHIQGLPFFLPIYNENCKINFYGVKDGEKGIKELIVSQMKRPFFPVELDAINKNMTFNEIKSNGRYEIHGLVIETFLTNHPSTTVTYKIMEGDKSVVYMTDNEINLSKKDALLTDDELRENNLSMINFCSKSDYLIHDAMYDENDVFSKKGWGHSSNKSLARFSALADIKNLILFHYEPEYTDSKIDKIIKETREVLGEFNENINCIGAMEGLEIII